MRKLPLVIFLAFLAGAIVTGIGSYKATEYRIRQDVQKALAMTVQELSCDKIDMDTIRCYRSHITIATVRDTACIAVRTVGNGKRQKAELVADHGCSFATVLAMSDQRAAGTLLMAGIFWLLGSMWYGRRKGMMTADALVSNGVVYGNLCYDTANARFVANNGKVMRLTPMQQELMEMFFLTDSHTLSKQEICDRFWPKKIDASETLYALIRRLKLVIESNSNLTIESERGKTYRLMD